MMKITKFKYIYISICLLAVSPSWAQKLKTEKLNDGKIMVKIPDHFIPMIPEDIAQRFPSVRKPMAAYTDEGRQSDQTVKISATQWGDNDQEIAMQFFKATIAEMFDKVDFLKSEIVERKKKKYILIEFVSYSRGSSTQPSERKYNYIQYYIKDLKTLVVSFRCPQSLMEMYQPMAEEIMQTFYVKKL